MMNIQQAMAASPIGQADLEVWPTEYSAYKTHINEPYRLNKGLRGMIPGEQFQYNSEQEMLSDIKARGLDVDTWQPHQ